MAVSWATPDEVKIMEWGSKVVKTNWWKMVEVGDAVVNGKEMSLENRMLEVPLFPIKADGKVITRVIQKFLATALTDNGSMHSVILNKKGDKIIWSCIEAVHGGAYAEVHQLTEDELKELNKTIAPLIFEDDIKGAFEIAKKFAMDKYKVDLGIIKIAHIQFFDEFRKAYERSRNGESILDHVAGVLGAVTNIYNNNWIRFYPAAKSLDLLGGMIRAGLNINPDEIRPMLEGLLTPAKNGIGLYTKDGWGAVIVFEVTKDDFKVDMKDADFCAQCYDRDIQKFANKIRKKTGVPKAFAIDVDALVKGLKPMMDAEPRWPMSPQTNEKRMEAINKFLPQYGKLYAASPVPITNKGWFKKLTGLDFSKPMPLPPSAGNLGLPLYLGMDGTIVYGFVNEKRELLNLAYIQMTGSSLKFMKSLDTKKYTPIVQREMANAKKLPLMQAAKAVKFQVTEDTEQWVTLCVLIDKPFLLNANAKMAELKGSKNFFKTRKFLRTYMTPAFLKHVLEERIAIYPPNPIFKRIKEEGILEFKWPL